MLARAELLADMVKNCSNMLPSRVSSKTRVSFGMVSLSPQALFMVSTVASWGSMKEILDWMKREKVGDAQISKDTHM